MKPIDAFLTALVCDECGRHTPVYLIHDPDTDEAIGYDVSKVYCKACAPEVMRKWMKRGLMV